MNLLKKALISYGKTPALSSLLLEFLYFSSLPPYTLSFLLTLRAVDALFLPSPEDSGEGRG